MGRATELTQQVQDRICEALRTGLHRHRAALYGGIGEATFYRWMEKGGEEPPAPPELGAVAIKTLRAMALVAKIPHNTRTTRPKLIAALQAAGTDPNAIYRRFREAVEAAELEMEMTLVAQWRLQAPDNPQVIKEILGRRFAQWRPPTSMELTGADGGPVDINVTEDDAIVAHIRKIAAARKLKDEQAQG